MRLSIVLILFAMALFVSCQQGDSTTTIVEQDGVWNTEKKRAWAANLRNEGLHDEACEVYEDLLDNHRDLEESTIIGSSVVVAEIHMKKSRYAKALKSLLRASQFEPQGELGRKIDTWKIECLERLGKTDAADRLLDRASAPTADQTKDKQDGGAVVAKIGSEEIRLSDLEELIAQQPPEMRARLEAEGGKIEVLKSLVAQRVLERKARKLGLEKDEKVQLALDLAAREILVRKLVADEVRDSGEVTAADAKLYYEANKARFRQPSTVEIAHIVVDDLAKEKDVREALATQPWATVCSIFSQDQKTRSQGGVIKGAFTEGQSHKVIGDVRGLFAAIGETQAQKIADKSLKTSAGRHIMKVMVRTDGQTYAFDQAKDAAMQLLRNEREQATVSELMQNALKNADVEIFEDKLSK